jgi:hypothetical protein
VAKIVPKKCESLLKAVLFAALLVFAACGGDRGAFAAPIFGAPARAAGTDLLVGSVRDSAGTPIAGAAVRASDAAGATVGIDRTEADGTFAVVLHGIAQTLEVRCTHCRTERVVVAGRSNLVLVIRRYGALESDVPAPADLSALPYGRIVDDLGLVPFTVPSFGGQDISDRGLGAGHGLVVDDGVPLVDLATGSSGLADFPDRYARQISVVGPQDAFRYGTYASGGVFALRPSDGEGSYGSADVGSAPSLTLEPAIGEIHPAYGESNDDGVLSRRADLDVTTGFAGGTLDAGVGASEQSTTAFAGIDPSSRVADLAHVDFATASRLYRTFVDVSAASVSQFDDAEQSDLYRSDYLAADVRLERPGPIALAAGALTTRETASYALPVYPYALLSGRAYDETAYVEAQTGDEHYGAHAGLGLSNVNADESLTLGRSAGGGMSLLPSLGGTAPLGGGAFVSAGYSQALRVRTLLESLVTPAPPPGAAPLDRDELAETAFGFDDSARVRAELIGYRQFASGASGERESGLGASLVWQLAPTISVRAWTLRATPLDLAGTYQPYAAFAGLDASRQVLWATYANGDGLRLDAILHRDGVAGNAVPLDADLWIPIVASAALSIGSAQVNGVRRYYVGLRTR